MQIFLCKNYALPLTELCRCEEYCENGLVETNTDAHPHIQFRRLFY